jgi:hypothetical protein
MKNISPETNLSSPSFSTTQGILEHESQTENMIPKSKYGWVEIISRESSHVHAFCRVVVNDLTGKLELFQDETMNQILFTVILGHPKLIVVVIKDVIYLRNLIESCSFRCNSVIEATEWSKLICYPMFSSIPITKSSECHWLYNNHSHHPQSASSSSSFSSPRPAVDEIDPNDETSLQNLAKQQIEFKIIELKRKDLQLQEEKKKLKQIQKQKLRHQNLLKQRELRIQNNPKLKSQLHSSKNRYNNLAEIFQNSHHQNSLKSTQQQSAGHLHDITPKSREIELAKQKRLVKQNYQKTLQVLVNNRQQILKQEFEIKKQKLLQIRQQQFEYSEQKLLEQLLNSEDDPISHDGDRHRRSSSVGSGGGSHGVRLMTPTKQFEQMYAIIKIQSLWRGAITRSVLENEKALLEIQSEILSTIESAQQFHNFYRQQHSDNLLQNQNHSHISHIPTHKEISQQYGSSGTFSSQAMKSIKELGYEVSSPLFSPSKPHEKKTPSHPSSSGGSGTGRSPRKGVTYYDPNATPSSSSNQPQPSNYPQPSSYLSSTYQPLSASTLPSYPPRINFSQTTPVPLIHLSPPLVSSSASLSTDTYYDHSTVNPSGWNPDLTVEGEDDRIGDNNRKSYFTLSDKQRMNLLTPVAENNSLRSTNSSPHRHQDDLMEPNYYLDRHNETSGQQLQTQVPLAPSASVISDLTDHDFSDGKGGVGHEDNESCYQSTTSQPMIERNNDGLQGGESQTKKITQNSILYPSLQVQTTNSSDNYSQISPDQYPSSAQRKSILTPHSQVPVQPPPQYLTQRISTHESPQVQPLPTQRMSIIAPRSIEVPQLQIPIQPPPQLPTQRMSIIAPLLRKDTPHPQAPVPPNQRMSIISPRSNDAPQQQAHIQPSPTQRKSILAPSLHSDETQPQPPQSQDPIQHQQRKSILAPQTHQPELPSQSLSQINETVSSDSPEGNLSSGSIRSNQGDQTSREPLPLTTDQLESENGFSRLTLLKESHSTKSNGSIRSTGSKRSQGFGVYIGTELVATASTVEEIPILMDKARQEKAAAAAAAAAAVAVAVEVSSSLGAGEEKQNDEKEFTSMKTQQIPLSEIENMIIPKKELKDEMTTNDPIPQGDESSLASGDSKTAFEVWVGGKLVGVAKTKDELPIIVAAAKAKEKLRKKFLKEKSKKSLRDHSVSESSRKSHSSKNNSSTNSSFSQSAEDEQFNDERTISATPDDEMSKSEETVS